MRTSSYTIYVPLPDEPDGYLLVHGYTGAVDWVSGQVARYLQAGPGEGYQPPADTLETLAQRGYLTAKSEDEETAYLVRLATALHRRHCHATSFLLAPSLSCQLRCVYCFEAEVVQAADNVPQARMTGEQVDAAYAAMDRIVLENKKQRPPKITLYGGEPLMAENRDLVTYLIEAGVKRGYRFRAITNGFQLNAYEHVLDKDKLGYLQVTLDGPAAIHDRRRPGKGGTPTFQTICANVDLALAKGCTVALRTNVDRRNLDSLVELRQFYHERGWSAQPSFYPYVNLVHGARQQNAQLKPTELLERGQTMSDPDTCQPITFDLGISNIFGGLLSQGELPGLRPYFCGASVGSYIFGPDGAIYTCWDEVGAAEGRIGRYWPHLEWEPERAQQWIDRNIANMPVCRKCAWALLCGGGCAHQARALTGSSLSGYCFEFPETFRQVAPHVYRRFQNAQAHLAESQQAQVCA